MLLVQGRVILQPFLRLSIINHVFSPALDWSSRCCVVVFTFIFAYYKFLWFIYEEFRCKSL